MPACTPPIDIRVFDAHTATPAEWTPYHAYRRLRAAQDFPELPLLGDDDFEYDLRRPLALSENVRLVALCGGEIAGNMILGMRREGTADYADFAPYIDVWGGVLRQHRRRGVASALLGYLHGFMRERGKTLASIRTQFPEGVAFLEAVGAQRKLRSVENHLALASVDGAALEAWRAHIDVAALPLRWEIHAPRVPRERLAQLMAPFSRLINEQPLGTLDIPAIRYDLAGYDAWYADMDLRGGDHYLVMLTDRAGQVAAMCDANWDERIPQRVNQSLTAVAAPWRGRGLAKAVKAAMLQLVRERRPEVTTMVTLNANENAPMLSINQRLGFRLNREECVYQIGTGALARFAPSSAVAISAE
jgi:GNAT superfamily N-acetyltransferase